VADIDVMFATNAPGVTREIDAAEKATTGAAKATAALDKASASVTSKLRAEADALKRAASAAREHQRELAKPIAWPKALAPENISAAVRSKTNIQRALRQQLAENKQLMEKGGDESAGGFGSGLRRGLERALNRPGFLGAKDSWVGKLGGGGEAGAGLAATIGLSAGFIAVSKAIQIADSALEIHLRHLDLAARGAMAYTHAIRAANEMNQAAGLATAQAQGHDLVRTVGAYGDAGQSKVNDLARSGFTIGDASSAYNSARVRFGDKADDALAIASRAARAGGTTLAENVNGLGGDELKNPDLAAARLLAVSRNQSGYSVAELQATESRLSGNNLTSSVAQINGLAGTRDVNAQALIPDGVMGARSAAAEAANPGQKYLAGLYTTSQEEVTVLHQINENMNGWAKVWDWITHPGNTVGQREDRAIDASVLQSGGH
jgi:hypothetical protein